MSTGHLSDYALDALANGRTTPERATHLASCASCQARWAQLEEADARLRMTQEFGKTREFALQDAQAARRRRHLKLFVAAPLAAAAMATVLLVQAPLRQEQAAQPAPQLVHAPTPPPATTSSPTLRVVRRESTAVLRPGERVEFEVAPAGATRALVMGVDESGAVAQIWPASGTESGMLPVGRKVTLTPGSWAPWKSTRVEVFLSREALDATVVRQAIAQAQQHPGTSFRHLKVGSIPGETARLSIVIDVAPAGAAGGAPLTGPR